LQSGLSLARWALWKHPTLLIATTTFPVLAKTRSIKSFCWQRSERAQKPERPSRMKAHWYVSSPMAMGPISATTTNPAPISSSAPPFWSSNKSLLSIIFNGVSAMNYQKFISNSFKSNASLLLTFCIAVAAAPAQATVAQAPLLLGGGNVPGNLALVPSVEFPTVISVANISNNYSHNATYTGYFDSEKCYEYNRQQITHIYFGTISGNDGGGYFTPTRWSRTCNGANEWSGNYLNWATTQTIDPFRMAL